MKTLKQKSINLYKKYTENPEAQNIRKHRALFIVPAVVIFVGISVITGVLMYERAMLRDDVDKLETENNSVSNKKLEDEYYALRAQIEFYSHAEEKMTQVFSAIEGSARINNDFFQKLSTAAASVITYTPPNYNYSDNFITIKASAPAKNDISAYVKRLIATGLFTDVHISGYQYSESSRRFDFTVTCRFTPIDLSAVADELNPEVTETTASEGISLSDIDSFFKTDK